MKQLITLSLLLISVFTFAQSEILPNSKNSISTQLAGTGGRFLSIKYERIISEKTKYRIGQTLGYAPSFSGSNSPAWFTEMNWIIGQNKHHLVSGIGYTMVLQNSQNSFFAQDTDGYTIFNLGYRYQDFTKDGLVVAVHANPIILENSGVRGEFWGGVSVGYSF